MNRAEDNENLLSFYAQVLDDNKDVDSTLRKHAIKHLSWYFNVDGLEVLTEGLRDTNPNNAKVAKEGVERVKLYLEVVAEIKTLKKNLKTNGKKTDAKQKDRWCTKSLLVEEHRERLGAPCPLSLRSSANSITEIQFSQQNASPIAHLSPISGLWGSAPNDRRI
jgi:hypothetical protein